MRLLTFRALPSSSRVCSVSFVKVMSFSERCQCEGKPGWSGQDTAVDGASDNRHIKGSFFLHHHFNKHFYQHVHLTLGLATQIQVNLIPLYWICSSVLLDSDRRRQWCLSLHIFKCHLFPGFSWLNKESASQELCAKGMHALLHRERKTSKEQ